METDSYNESRATHSGTLRWVRVAVGELDSGSHPKPLHPIAVRVMRRQFPGGSEEIHWSIPDLAAAGDARAVSVAFTQTATELHTRIDALLARLLPAAA